MKKRSIIAAVLMLTLMTGCFKNYDEVGLTDSNPAETTAEATAGSDASSGTEVDPTEGSIDPSDKVLPPVDINEWKITTERENDVQQKILFEKEGSRFVGRLVLPDAAASRLPTVVILEYSPMMPNAFSYNKGTIDGITSNGMACILIEAFGSGDSIGTFESLTFENVNEMLTVFYSNLEKIPEVDSSKTVLWVNSQATLFALYAMQDKSDKVSAIFLPAPFYTDGALLREHYPDRDKIPQDSSYDFYLDQMYDVDAEDFFKNIKTKVYVFLPDFEVPDASEMYEKYTNYFPDKVYETVGKESDYEKGIYKGQGPVFEKIVEDLKAVFGI